MGVVKSRNKLNNTFMTFYNMMIDFQKTQNSTKTNDEIQNEGAK